MNALERLKYVFTKEYREETEYFELMERMKSKIKLNTVSENIDDKISRLAVAGYESNCSIAIGNYEDEYVQTENQKVKKLGK